MASLTTFELAIVALPAAVTGAFFLKWLPGVMPYLHALRTQTRRPGDVRDGLTAVRGEAIALEETNEAPYSNEECLVYQQQTDKYATRRYSGNWQRLFRGKQTAAFEVRDEMGSVRVDPSDAELFLSKSYQTAADRGDEPPAPEDVDGDAVGGPIVELPEGERRYTEWRLDPGQEVYILGVADTDGPGNELTISGPADDGMLSPEMMVAGDGGSAAIRSEYLTDVLVLVGLLCLIAGNGLFIWFVA